MLFNLFESNGKPFGEKLCNRKKEKWNCLILDIYLSVCVWDGCAASELCECAAVAHPVLEPIH